MKFDKIIKLKLKDVLFGYNETENSSDVLEWTELVIRKTSFKKSDKLFIYF